MHTQAISLWRRQWLQRRKWWEGRNLLWVEHGDWTLKIWKPAVLWISRHFIATEWCHVCWKQWRQPPPAQVHSFAAITESAYTTSLCAIRIPIALMPVMRNTAVSNHWWYHPGMWCTVGIPLLQWCIDLKTVWWLSWAWCLVHLTLIWKLFLTASHSYIWRPVKLLTVAHSSLQRHCSLA